jgi:hypothetical protein
VKGGGGGGLTTGAGAVRIGGMLFLGSFDTVIV